MQYPSEVAAECVDPLYGIARTFKYEAPNISDIVEWCDARMKHHELWAKWQPRGPTLVLPPASPEMAEKVVGFWRSLADRLRLSPAPDPLKNAHRERAEQLAKKREAVLAQRMARMDPEGGIPGRQLEPATTEGA